MQVMIKRFRSSKKVWMKYHLFALRKDPSGTTATKLLKRSLQSLSKHKHNLVISNFAQVGGLGWDGRRYSPEP